MRVVSVGTFDPLHDGHRALFADMRKLAGADGEVIVGVNGDRFYAEYRHATPFQSDADRLAAVAADVNVSAAYINNDTHLQGAQILAQKPDLFVMGMDWANDNYLKQIGVPSWGWFTDHDITMLFTPRHGTVSSTQLREAGRGR